jgi:hypothetical protein
MAMTMEMKYWIVICYENDKHDADTIGIYSTRDKALQDILILMKEEYNELKEEEEEEISEVVEDWFPNWNGKKIPTWDDFKKEIIKNLKRGECDGLFSTNYKITKHIVDKKM